MSFRSHNRRDFFRNSGTAALGAALAGGASSARAEAADAALPAPSPN